MDSTTAGQPECLKDSDAYIQAKSQEFLYVLSNLYLEFVVEKKQALIFFKYCRFLTNIIYNLSKTEISLNDERLGIIEAVFKVDSFIRCLLALGYRLNPRFTDSVMLILDDQPSKQVLSKIMEVMKVEYLQNPSLVAVVEAERKALEKKEEKKEKKEEIKYVPVNPKVTLAEQRAHMQDQLNDYRKMKKENKKSKDVPDPEDADEDEEEKEEPKPFDRKLEEERVKFGKHALELTNEYRETNGLPPLVWNQELSDIAMKHSKKIAARKMAVSHQNFEEILEQISFKTSRVAENVGGSASEPSPATDMVEGWALIPSFRKNLLSQTNVCGVACDRAADGTWYFTQIFAQKEEKYPMNFVIVMIVISIILFQYFRSGSGNDLYRYDL